MSIELNFDLWMEQCFPSNHSTRSYAVLFDRNHFCQRTYFFRSTTMLFPFFYWTLITLLFFYFFFLLWPCIASCLCWFENLFRTIWFESIQNMRTIPVPPLETTGSNTHYTMAEQGIHPYSVLKKYTKFAFELPVLWHCLVSCAINFFVYFLICL